MRFRHLTTILVLAAFSAVAMIQPVQAKSIFKELKFPEYPGAKLSKELTLPAGLRDRIVEEFGDLLGITDLRQVVINTYDLDDSDGSSDILKSLDAAIEQQKWHTLARLLDKDGSAFMILTKESEGMLILKIDPSGAYGREMSLLQIAGSIDMKKLADFDPKKASGSVAGMFKSGIPVDQPISIPPSEKLNIQATKSDVTVRFAGSNTVMVEAMGAKKAGELSRTQDGRLLLALTPKLRISEINAPSNVPVLIELTDGRLNLSAGTSAGDRPQRLNVIATGAPVIFDSFPLISGTHSVKSVGKPVDIYLTQVQGGVLEVEAQSGNVTVVLPRDTSATIELSAVSGSVQNMLGYEPISTDGDTTTLKVGEGKASISLKAIKGNVTVRFSE